MIIVCNMKIIDTSTVLCALRYIFLYYNTLDFIVLSSGRQ